MWTLSARPAEVPSTRFMGSKRGIVTHIWDSVKDLPFNTVLDAFSGSCCVSYMFKSQGKAVISNDFLKYSYHLVNALVANQGDILSECDVAMLLEANPDRKDFI